MVPTRLNLWLSGRRTRIRRFTGARQGASICVRRFGTGQRCDPHWVRGNASGYGRAVGRGLSIQVLHVFLGLSWHARLCTSQQSVLKSRRDNSASAIPFTAEERKGYYFRTQPSPRAVAGSAVTGVPNGDVEVAAVDPAQAQLMIRKWAYSTSQPKSIGFGPERTFLRDSNKTRKESV